MKDVITNYNGPKHLITQFIRTRYPDLYNEIFNISPLLEGYSFNTKIFWYVNGLKDFPVCEICGNPLKKDVKSLEKGYGLKVCSNSCAQRLPSVRNKIKDTCKNLYGVEHHLQNPSILGKSVDTLKRLYGVENPSKISGVQSKIEGTNIKRYGVPRPLKNVDIKDRLISSKNIRQYNIIKNSQYVNPEFTLEEYIKNTTGELDWTCKKCGKRFKGYRDYNWHGVPRCMDCYPVLITTSSSYSEKEISDFVKTLLTPSEVFENYGDLINPFEVDIYIPSKKLAIEYDGLYWHSDKFKDKFGHLKKTDNCQEKDVRLIHVFEDEWIHKRPIVESRIRSLLNISQTKIFARKCEIVPTSWDDTRKFLEENHIQGSCNSSINLGLYFEGILTSIMTFGSLRKALGHSSKEGNFELLRFCSKLNHNVVGGASKLLKYFIRNHNPKVIISYADRRWSIGNVYEKLGFKLSHVSKPNYWYVQNNNRKHRFGFRKSNLKGVLKVYDETKSEAENMTDNGYMRIWDCGNMVYRMEF